MRAVHLHEEANAVTAFKLRRLLLLLLLLATATANTTPPFTHSPHHFKPSLWPSHAPCPGVRLHVQTCPPLPHAAHAGNLAAVDDGGGTCSNAAAG